MDRGSSEASLGSNYFQWNISQEKGMIKSVEVVFLSGDSYYGYYFNSNRGNFSFESNLEGFGRVDFYLIAVLELLWQWI